MVTISAAHLKDQAEQLFRSADVPASLSFFEDLSPLNQRLFVVELWDALSRASISGGEDDFRVLVEVVEGWEATADLERAPEVLAEIRRPKEYHPLDLERLRTQ